MDIKDVQMQAWTNKVIKGFCLDNVQQEFALTFAELGEAFTAWMRNDTRHELGSELADVLIYLTGIATMCEIDLDDAVRDKLAVNATRIYRRTSSGKLIKDTGV